jgi:hypothetical protein
MIHSLFCNLPSTPWGPAQTSDELAPGVVHYTTASHGGYCVSGAALARMEPFLRALPTFCHATTADSAWYEEDVDWAVVALAFPELFDGCHLWHAERTVRVARADACAWLDQSDPGRAVRDKLAAWQESNACLFFATTSKRDADGSWTVCFHSVNGRSQCVISGLSNDEHWASQSLIDVKKHFGDRAVVMPRIALGIEAAIAALQS